MVPVEGSQCTVPEARNERHVLSGKTALVGQLVGCTDAGVRNGDVGRAVVARRRRQDARSLDITAGTLVSPRNLGG